MLTYDKHYKAPNYFGEPYPELIQFFKEYEPKGHVLDLGCGQGRDCARGSWGGSRGRRGGSGGLSWLRWGG